MTKQMRLYAYADLGRFGLAHSLLAWARCVLWSQDRDVPMLAPNWLQLRLGPYLRRERDKRQYHRYFQYPGYITGLRRLYLLLTLPRIDAEQPSKEFESGRAVGLVTFKNLPIGLEGGQFADIVGRQAAVRSALVAMTRPEYRPATPASAFIAIHIRMGDFQVPVSDDAIRRGATNVRLPVSWYASMLTQLRQQLGYRVPARLYSDGSDESLAEILTLDAVTRVRAAAAITELLEMSSAAALVSSGSGFSLWGSYLGEVPRISYPGQRLVRVHGAPRSVDLEPECDEQAPLPEDFIRYVSATIGPLSKQTVR